MESDTSQEPPRENYSYLKWKTLNRTHLCSLILFVIPNCKNNLITEHGFLLDWSRHLFLKGKISIIKQKTETEITK